MWKIAVAFVVFAAIAIGVLMKGPDIDLGGEQHGVPAASGAASGSH